MLRYSDAETYVKAGLVALGYGTDPAKPMPVFDPGPTTEARLMKKTPQALIFLTIGNGVGLTTEAVYDRPFITARVIGPQRDFTSAETLAYDVDNILLAVANGVTMGNAHVLYVTRAGGPPQLVELDNGERYHYQATYITEVTR